MQALLFAWAEMVPSRKRRHRHQCGDSAASSGDAESAFLPQFKLLGTYPIDVH
jgi:hypothetical protein